MTKTRFSMLILTVVLALSPMLLLGATEDSEDKTEGLATDELRTEETIAMLQTEYALWLDAVLSGSKAEARELEKSLVGMINFNIMTSQESVRAMAKEAALVPSDPVAKMTEEGRQDELKKAIQHLNAKEALFRSAVKTNAFSNKYRLLGDYIDLLRRELKMPRLKLAASGHPVSTQKTDPASEE